jgi:hypothetical protein
MPGLGHICYMLGIEDSIHAPVAEWVKIETKNYFRGGDGSPWPKFFEKDGGEDSLLALLLPKFTNLRTLELQCSPRRECRESGQFSVGDMLCRVAQKKAPFDTQPAFTKLQSFFCSYLGYEYGRGRGSFHHIPWYAAFFYPSIRSITCEGPINSPGHDLDYDDWSGGKTFGPQSSSCSNLEWRRFTWKLECDVIGKLLSYPKALKTFTCVNLTARPSTPKDRDDRAPSEGPRRTRLAIRRGLQQQKETLEDLWLDIDSHERWEGRPGLSKAQIRFGTIASFPRGLPYLDFRSSGVSV